MERHRAQLSPVFPKLIHPGTRVLREESHQTTAGPEWTPVSFISGSRIALMKPTSVSDFVNYDV